MISERPIKKLKRSHSGVSTRDKKSYFGTSSESIYVYDYQTTDLITKFQDVPYGDKLFLNEDNSLLVVKGTAGKIGVYDTKSLKLKYVVKMKGSSQPQDENLCFSLCGKYLYNIVYVDTLLSHLVKIDLADGSYENIYSRLNEVYSQIHFVKQHNLYYLFGFERGSSNRYFVRILNSDFVECNEIELENSPSQVEYSPKEDLFYINYLGNYSVKVLSKDFSKTIKEISSQTITETIKGKHSKREVTSSVYGYIIGFSLSTDTLYLAITYVTAVVVFDDTGKEQRVFPMLCGSARFLNNSDEIMIKGDIYRIIK
ncbi:MAG: hypothetical protein U1C51_05245 [Candidatus Izemoplasmatales bacterium]|nr:hypothetical protein [bacterium]MDZ4196641.1 hypothetical protein [Candidatus Izemoplasmatales bacterium]